MSTVKSTMIEQIGVSDLLQSFEKIVSEKVSQAIKEQSGLTEPPEFLTRKEVAQLFHITLPTVHNWTNAGILKAYKIGAKTRYKRSEVMECPKAMKHDLNNN